jgi:uncharacterized protein (TIGR00106 family)
MSVLLDLTMFPTGKGESVSPYVARIIAMIDERKLDYQLTPMGTIIEFAGLDEALAVVKDAYDLLEPDCSRVYATVKLDIRKGEAGRLTRKVESVEQKIGRKVRT